MEVGGSERGTAAPVQLQCHNRRRVRESLCYQLQVLTRYKEQVLLLQVLDREEEQKLI